jgi:ParB family chromosome partitioning protein
VTHAQKIVLSSSRDIPFNKLLLSQSNVRRIKAGVSIEELAEDIARRTLLQSITVRPVCDAEGAETGMYEVPAGGRRFRALELLVKQKRLAKTAPVPCVIRTDGIAEEDSLAENIQRAPLHPLDQFRAFLALREKGQSEEEIAAAFFVAVPVVKQRLRLASVSPKLLDVYAEDGMTLDQLMAFTVSGDHERQEQVYERLWSSYAKDPSYIRRALTEGAVRAADKRAQFIGLDAYVEAGGVILRDLFHGDDGGWLQDVALVERMVAEALERAAEGVRAEGWRWIEISSDFPYGHTFGLRQLRGEGDPLTEDERATFNALQDEYNTLSETYADAEELPDAVDQRFGEIETALEAFQNRPVRYDPDEVARAGAFISIDGAGNLRIERGYVRPEDELPIEAETVVTGEDDDGQRVAIATEVEGGDAVIAGEPEDEPEEDGSKPISDRLMTELTTHRTLALRQALGEQPTVAFHAALHALCLKVFYRYTVDSCLELDLKITGFSSQIPGLNDAPAVKAISDRHQAWLNALPKEPADLWEALVGFDGDSQGALFAHCISLSVNAVYETYNRRPRAMAHADQLAQATDLDMVSAGWVPTIDTYLGRVTKTRILGAVREARGERAAQLIDHLKKGEMAEKAQDLLAGSGWLPEPLRTPGRVTSPVAEVQPDASGETDPDEVAAFDIERDAQREAGESEAVDDPEPVIEPEAPAVQAHAIAAE